MPSNTPNDEASTVECSAGISEGPGSGERVSGAVIVWATFCTVATWILCRFHPYDVGDTVALTPSAPWLDAWIGCQAGCLIGSLLLIYRFSFPRRLRWIRTPTLFVMACMPLVIYANAISFAWIGRPLVSLDTIRHLISHSHAVVAHVSSGTWKLAIWAGGGLVAFVLIGGFIAHCLGKVWDSRARGVRPSIGYTAAMVILILLSTPLLSAREELSNHMLLSHTRHPFCVCGLVARGETDVTTRSTESAGLPVSPGSDDRNHPLMESPLGARGVASQMRQRIDFKSSRLAKLRALTSRREEGIPDSDIASDTDSDRGLASTDVLVVVIESMRPELVDPSVMPNLYSYAERGIDCRNHFSGGNATTHGMFSLFNGIDAIWYSLPVRSDPLMLRLFRQAGYQTGFFAGHNDWKKFKMDGFVGPRVFDIYRDQTNRWLTTDRQAVEWTARFLDPNRESRQPRLAVLYLYSTHADYRSFASEQVFRPAARDGFAIPYTKSMRDSVWNRYKNSARSVDRLLAGVLREDRIVVVVGDHGESFLEDGVCGHGTKLNRFQNATPMVVYAPDGKQATVNSPTSHADLLPTLLDVTGIVVSDPDVMDGTSLLRPIGPSRVILTRNYLDHDCWMISNLDRDLAFRFQIITQEWNVRYQGSADCRSANEVQFGTVRERGSGRKSETTAFNSDISHRQVLDQWMLTRLPKP